MLIAWQERYSNPFWRFICWTFPSPPNFDYLWEIHWQKWILRLRDPGTCGIHCLTEMQPCTPKGEENQRGGKKKDKVCGSLRRHEVCESIPLQLTENHHMLKTFWRQEPPEVVTSHCNGLILLKAGTLCLRVEGKFWFRGSDGISWQRGSCFSRASSGESVS